MLRNTVTIALAVTIASIMLLGSVSCSKTDAQFTRGSPAVYVQEASWARSYRNLNELCADPDIQIIAIGAISRIVSVTEKNQFTHNTKFSFRVERLLKGEQTDEVLINQMGAPDKPGSDFPDDPLFEVGDRYLLFLKVRDGVFFHPGPWGRYQVVDNKVYSLSKALIGSEVYHAPEALDFNGASLDVVALSIIETLDAAK